MFQLLHPFGTFLSFGSFSLNDLARVFAPYCILQPRVRFHLAQLIRTSSFSITFSHRIKSASSLLTRVRVRLLLDISTIGRWKIRENRINKTWRDYPVLFLTCFRPVSDGRLWETTDFMRRNLYTSIDRRVLYVSYDNNKVSNFWRVTWNVRKFLK